MFRNSGRTKIVIQLLHDVWIPDAFLCEFVAISPTHGLVFEGLEDVYASRYHYTSSPTSSSPWTGLADRPDMCLLDRDEAFGISLPHSLLPIGQHDRQSKFTKTTASCAPAGRHLMLHFLQEPVLMGITMLNNSPLVKRLDTLSSLTRTYRRHSDCTSS